MTRWLYPVQEGSELWGKTTKQPTATRVHGVKTDDEARLVAAAFEPQISHFHQAQAGQRALGGLPTYKTRSQPVPGLQLAYTYNNGLEYLDIGVSLGLLKQLTTGPEDFWDYALVELVLDDTHYRDRAVELICYAHMTAPREDALTDDSVWPADGVASNERTRTTVDPIINAANSAATIASVPSSDTEKSAASFTVDIRSSRGGASTLDVYAYVYGANEILPSGVSLWASNGYIVEDPSGTMGPVHADVQPPYPGLDMATDWTTAPVFVAPVPTAHFDYTSLTWVYDINGTDSWVHDNGYFYDGWLRPGTASNPSSDPIYAPGQSSNADMYPVGDPLFTANPWHKTHNWDFWHVFTVSTYIPPYSGPDKIPGELQVTYFKGVPKLAATKFVTGHDYDRWCAGAGNVIGPMVRMPVTVPAYTNATLPSTGQPPRLDNFYNVPKLGAAVLDTHRIVKERPGIIVSGSWKAA